MVRGESVAEVFSDEWKHGGVGGFDGRAVAAAEAVFAILD